MKQLCPDTCATDARVREEQGRLRAAARTAASLPLLVARALRYRTLGWLPHHLASHRAFDPRLFANETPIDVMVLVADHFEPVYEPNAEAASRSVQTWCEAYERIADHHRDADGRPPQHSWFYPADYPNSECVQVLSTSVFRGFGEIEFHLHHGFDKHESFAAKLRAGLEWFNRQGALLTAEAKPRRRFGYVAGNWALDNGAGDASLSGCDTELLALQEVGCYADFTFPALGSPAQPHKTNAIYYPRNRPGPKSYDTGIDVEVGRAPAGGLLLLQGPLVVDWGAGKLEDGALESWAPPSPDRLAAWLKAHVHVRGRPEWVFVKLHTHGIQSRETFLSPALDELFEAMERCWNRPPFRLHYVTAREAYNIAKAAEAGLDGNPNDYRDFLITVPANRRVRCSSPWLLLGHSREIVSVRILEPGPTRVDFATSPLHSARGCFQRLDARFQDGQLAAVQLEGEGELNIHANDRSGAAISRRFVCDGLMRLHVPWTNGQPGSSNGSAEPTP
jgi:hypothetical protein